jgi:ABC-type branched-subunit amino acid transport system substrate-binding protein
MGIGTKFDLPHHSMYSVKKNFLACFFLACCLITKAADTTQLPLRIAVLIPLNLDSAFTGYEYNLSNTRIPQYFLSGLDFYSGVMLAIDSLQKENANVEVWIYDMHKQNQSLQQLTDEMQSMNFSLIIASISNSSEQKTISDFSAKNSIPVISATFPNDNYLNSNPFFIMINPTWQTHIDAVYDYLLKNYNGRKITLFTRKGTLEDKITEALQKKNAKQLLNFSTVILSDDFSDEDVLKHLDSTSQNIVLCGSLLEGFGKALIKTLNDNGATYQTILMGMPTWSGMAGTTGSDAENIQIVITTPYNYLPGSNNFIDAVANKYKLSYYSRPSDMVLKGYETMYHFAKLLLAYPDNFINSVSDTSYTISNNYSFQPVRLSQTSFVPDFLENKKIYFIRITGGKIQSIE